MKLALPPATAKKAEMEKKGREKNILNYDTTSRYQNIYWHNERS